MDGNGDGRSEDWGPFGRPLFKDSKSHDLSRVGVVDIGSNSVRLVVFDGAARSPAYFYNEKIMCALGAGLGETGHLNPEGKLRALSALRRFQLLADGMHLPPLTAVATAAMREATDGPAFCEEIMEKTGLDIQVITGEEEARFSAQGVLLGWPEANGLVCDIGGSSMELAEGHQGRVGHCVTSPLGPLKLQGIKGGKKAVREHIAAVIGDLVGKLGKENKRLYLVGGSWRAFGRLDMERRNYPLHVLHEYRMSPKSARATVRWIADSNIEQLRHRTGTSEARMSLVPLASDVLFQLIKQFKPREIALSSYGIREGMLYQEMPEDLRHRDPLIDACRFAEAKDARLPGFGRILNQFINPLFATESAARKRMILAACLLHDVTWRAHPDYRAEVCFDNATRANLGGLTHTERIWLGLALLHRYKNSRDGSRFGELFALLSADEIRSAEAVGKAMRFGAMFSVDSPDKVASLDWRPKKKVLTLTLSERGMGLFGEVASSRFSTLAAALEATAQIKQA